jgi:hypothetical protein
VAVPGSIEPRATSQLKKTPTHPHEDGKTEKCAWRCVAIDISGWSIPCDSMFCSIQATPAAGAGPSQPGFRGQMGFGYRNNRLRNKGFLPSCGGSFNFLIRGTCAGARGGLDSSVRRGTSSSRRIKFRPPDATQRIRRKRESIAISSCRIDRVAGER